MNKADKIFVAIVLICAVALYIPLLLIQKQTADLKKDVVVYVKDKEVLRVNIDTDETYQVNGTLGDVQIEVLDGRVRVEKENSPYHLCSIQGWVESSVTPIICLPNDVWVKLENVDSDLDVIIQ